MFKRFSLFIVPVLFIMLTGCATTEITGNSLKSISATNKLFKMQTSRPDASSLGQNPVTDGGKYYFNLVKEYITDPLTIPAVDADPATDERALFIIQARNSYEATANGIVRFFTNLPAGADFGYIGFRNGVYQQYVKTEDSYDLILSFPANSLEEAEKLKEQTMAYFDEFITKNDAWKKETRLGKDITEHSINSIKANREIIEKYSTAPDKEQTLKELDYSLARLQKKLDEDKFPHICVYSYRWKSGNQLNHITFDLNTNGTGFNITGRTWINK